jgi:hypothetical protein
VTIAGPTRLDVDVPAVVRTGSFKLNQASPPASIYENGEVLLRDTRSGELISLGQTRLQTYSRVIVPGTYDVIYSRLMGETIVPRNARAVIATGVELTAGGALDINIPVVTVQGQLTLDGGAFPGSNYNRARIWLQGATEGDTLSLGTTESPSYTAPVVPGGYDVVYEGLISTGVVPENAWGVVSRGHLIVKPKGVGGSPRPATLDVNVQSGLLVADVTLWGQPTPNSIYENGAIYAVSVEGDRVEVGQTRQGGGSVRLLAGDYGLHYARLMGEAIVPHNGDARVGSATVAAGQVDVSIDLQPGVLSGTFTQAGGHFPPYLWTRGDVSLRDLETGEKIELGSTADGGYERRLLGGDYELVYDHVVGASVVANRGATLGCLRFAPPMPLVVGGPLHAL